MQQLQQQLTQLTGHVERVELKVNDVAAQLERMQKDTEYRLGALEGGGAGAGAVMMGADAAGQDPSMAGQPGAAEQTLPGAQAGAQVGAPQSPPPPAPGQPGVLGTLSAEQAANLPQAPAGAAEEAAARAGQQVAVPTGAALPSNASPREQYEYATNLIQRGAYDEAGSSARMRRYSTRP